MRFRLSTVDLPLILAIFVISVSALIYEASNRLERHAQHRIISDVVAIVGNALNNLTGKIKGMVGDQDVVLALYMSEELRREVEELLSLLVTPAVKYVYMVYRDDGGRFRFLADGSKEDRANLGEKLDLLEEEKGKWNRAWEKGEPVVIIHKGIRTLGATYIRPLRQEGYVKALLVADLSVGEIEDIQETLGIIKHLSTGTSIASVLFLTMALYQYIKKKRLERILYTDSLTGLFNKAYLDVKSVSIDVAKGFLALLDVDDFRKVNTTYGSKVGDIVIKELANFIRSRLPEGSLIVRYAGEEFLILVPRDLFKDKSEVVKFFEDLKNGIRENVFKTSKGDVRVTVSIGVNLSTDRTRSLGEAIKGADKALYRAKKEGKDRVEAYDETVEELRKIISVDEVREAIAERRLLCHYQPIVNLETGEISHYEALARIVDRTGRILSPYHFLEDIKDTFLYNQFVREIIRLNADLLLKRKDLKVSVNLLPADLIDQSIIETLSFLDPDVRRRLLLEITEVEGIPSFERVRESIGHLQDLGFRVCIDDFGTGYSNLINLTRLRVDFLKIDGSIIRDIHRNRISYLLTEKVTEFCREVNIEVIAEYVESAEIAEKLKEIGIKYGQGFYLGKPSETI